MYDDEEMSTSDKLACCFFAGFILVLIVAIGLSVGIIAMAILEGVSYASAGM